MMPAAFYDHGMAVNVANHRAAFTGVRHAVKGRRCALTGWWSWAVESR